MATCRVGSDFCVRFDKHIAAENVVAETNIRDQITSRKLDNCNQIFDLANK